MRPDPGARLGLLVALAIPAVAGAQVTLQYRPPLGARIQTVSDNRMTTTVFGLPSLPDSTVIQSDWRTVRTTRVLEAGDRPRLRVSLDSSRSRTQVTGSPRTDVALPGLEGLTLDVVVDGRLGVQRATPAAPGVADSGAVAYVRAGAGGMEMQLPRDPIAIGYNWDTPLRYPFGAYLTAGGKLGAVESLAGTAAVILDSLRVRGADTLAFLTLTATFDPARMVIAGEGGVGTGTVTGGVAAALVWSTGWNAMVSAATNGRFQVALHLERADGPPVEGTVSLAMSGRHQVRW